MKRTNWTRAAAVFFILALVLVMIGIPGNAKADVTAVSLSPTSPQVIRIGDSVTVTATPTQSGSPTTTTYEWTVSPAGIVTPDTAATSSVTFTGVAAGTATVSVKVYDDLDTAASKPGVTQTYTIYVSSLSVSLADSTRAPGNTTTATASNYVGSITKWVSSNPSVATVLDNNAAVTTVTAVGSGTTNITATCTLPNGATQTASAVFTVPTVTLNPPSQTLTTGSATTTLTLSVTNGGTVIPTGSTVSWSTSDGAIGTLSGATTVSASGIATVNFTSSAAATNGTATIYATVGGMTRTATVTVSTVKHLEIVGPASLDKTTRTGTYTVYLKNPDGSVYDDDTSTVHWSWSSSYLSITSDDINDRRADMHDGEAHIQLYAKYNTPSGGTKLYAWINSDTAGKVYHTITITGLSSLPQTGQNMTLVYLFGGLSAALLAAAGVWYGIRKKHTVA